jgi:hypothetical protein
MEEERYSGRPPGSYGLLDEAGTIAAGESASHTINTIPVGYLAGHITVSAAATLKIYYSMSGDAYGDPVEEALTAGQSLDFDCGENLAAQSVKIEIVAGAANVEYALQCRGMA